MEPLIVNRLPYLLCRRILTCVDKCKKPQISTPIFFFKYSIHKLDNCTIRFIFLRGFRKYTNMTSYDGSFAELPLREFRLKNEIFDDFARPKTVVRFR